ncbi:hypothetical protein DEU56DRAFT_88812 [Suillus clintonianus]|uniref:uncharacterized protein n=1 Tax=Suillus clintonianus TaxID=1904413 RepID=UPI001B86E96F|nr:uncharacterized protein DEU56DRAFT_88812 [Suillus clintonianus]KAG2121907.1 hypothetical protein DEU56DRAFT_88812 [Suillus clintonianus]
MDMSNTDFTPGSLYIAGFAQARAPHVGLIIPTSRASGCLVHIRIDRDVSPVWTYQSRVQRIEGDMFISSLLRIKDVSAGPIALEQLQEAAQSVPAPQNDEFGECLPWVLAVVQKLHDMGLVVLKDAEALQVEFVRFAEGNKAYARRDKFPNIAASQFCR